MAAISSNEQTESLLDNSSSLGTRALGYNSVPNNNQNITKPLKREEEEIQGFEEMHEKVVF